MSRKRKTKAISAIRALAAEENNENDMPEDAAMITKKVSTKNPIHTIVQNAQVNETFHGKYIRELQQIYSRTGHFIFMQIMKDVFKQLLYRLEGHKYADIALEFLAKFVTSFDDNDSVLSDTFKFLLSTTSLNHTIRFRICQVVNLLLSSLGLEAALDDDLCDDIQKYMTDRLKDPSASVRVQAVHALQRLQIPDNPNDAIVKLYQFHLSNDPSVVVRQAVITSIGRNFHTMPSILERLCDIDERVRRHTYLQMSSYPVRAYKVAQRLTFLEQGLNEHSEVVKKVVTGVLLPHWFETYNKNCITFASALKLDANEHEIERSRKTTKLALFTIFRHFKNTKVDDLITALPFENEYEFEKCIPIDKLNDENALYWLSLIEYCKETNSKFADEIDAIIPDLSTFCNYLKKFFLSIAGERDIWKKFKNQYLLLTLIEILLTYDLGDEIGRNNLKALLKHTLINEELNEKIIIKIVKCIEELITEQDSRLQYVVDVIREIIDANSVNTSLDLFSPQNVAILEAQNDINLMVRVSSFKCQIMELREQETELLNQKKYVDAKHVTEKLANISDEFSNLIQPYLNNQTISDSSQSTISSNLQSKKLTTEKIIKCLQITFYTVSSKYVTTLTPSILQLYHDFIRRQIESGQMFVRDWGLKCGTAFSMLYGLLAKDVYKELFIQFYRHQHAQLWATAITALFDLIDRYGFDYFGEQDPEQNQDSQNEILVRKSKDKSKKSSRQLYNTTDYQEIQEEDNDDTNKKAGTSVDLMHLFGHMLNTCADSEIIKPLIDGLCRLVLRGHYKSDDLLSKLLLRYFNPTTESEINQILGIFLKQLIVLKKQECLQPALLPTLFVILESPNDSPLREILPANVLKFVIKSTKPIYSSSGLNIHNTIALAFIQVMIDNPMNKELMRVLSKELETLEVSDDPTLRNDLINCLEKLLKIELEPKTESALKTFTQILNGTYKGASVRFSSSILPTTAASNATKLTTLADDADIDIDNNDDEGPSDCEMADAAVVTNDNDNDSDKCNDNDSANANGKQSVNGLEHSTNEQNDMQTNSDQMVNDIRDEKDKNVSANPVSEKNTSNTSNTSNTINDSINESNAILSPSLSTTQVITKQITPPQILTPTTYGAENTTQLRYLRKSMHTRDLSDSKSSSDVDGDGDGDGGDGNISNSSSKSNSTPSPPKVKATEGVKNTRTKRNVSKILLEKNNIQSNVSSNDDDAANAADDADDDDDDDDNRLHKSSTSEVIPCSPEITANRRSSRPIRRAITEKNKNSANKSGKKLVNNQKTPSDTNLRTSKEGVKSKSARVTKTQNSNTAINKTLPDPPRRKSSAASAVTQVDKTQSAKAPLPYSTGIISTYQTRRNTIELNKFKNIMTRRSLSLIDMKNTPKTSKNVGKLAKPSSVSGSSQSLTSTVAGPSSSSLSSLNAQQRGTRKSVSNINTIGRSKSTVTTANKGIQKSKSTSKIPLKSSSKTQSSIGQEKSNNKKQPEAKPQSLPPPINKKPPIINKNIPLKSNSLLQTKQRSQSSSSSSSLVRTTARQLTIRKNQLTTNGKAAAVVATAGAAQRSRSASTSKGRPKINPPINNKLKNTANTPKPMSVVDKQTVKNKTPLGAAVTVTAERLTRSATKNKTAGVAEKKTKK